MSALKLLAVLPWMAASALTQQHVVQQPGGNFLSPQEVAAAIALPANSGYAMIDDQNFLDGGRCTAQKPSVTVFTPAGWINAQSQAQKKQFLPYTPSEDDIVRALTVVSKGCVNNTPAGPVCDPLTRVVLASDKPGVAPVEAVITNKMDQAWTDANGVSVNCTGLATRYAMSDVLALRNAKGEFTIATFSGSTPVKVYVVKEKYQKKLGL